MNNGNRRRSRRKYKLRYDRIIAVVLVLIVLIVVITSCAKGCNKDDKQKDKGSQSSVVDELTSSNSSQPASENVSSKPTSSNDAQPSSSANAEYTEINVDYAQVSKGDLVLVNSLHPYAFAPDDVNVITLFDNMNSSYSVKDNLVSLDSNVVSQLNALMEAYAAATSNTDLQVITSYRTLEEQNDRYNNAKTTIAGGYSDFHTARSFDIGIFPKDSDSYYYSPQYSETVNYGWFDENAANYGFVLRFPEDKASVTGDSGSTYTYRYVGVPHAVYMKQNNLCLEEYIEQVKTYTSTNTLKITNGTAQYEVYYVPAAANAATAVPVPSNRQYTISGNNVDGFIIAVMPA